jgi:hypothetical protein
MGRERGLGLPRTTRHILNPRCLARRALIDVRYFVLLVRDLLTTVRTSEPWITANIHHEVGRKSMSLGSFAAAAMSSWLSRKSLDWSWKQLWKWYSPTDFKHSLERAWASDPTLRNACNPPPTFDSSRFGKKHFRDVLKMVLNQEEELLGAYLFDQSLIVLPWIHKSTRKPKAEIARCVARVTIETAIKAIVANDELSREFQLFTSLHFAASHAEILVVLSELRQAGDDLTDAMFRRDDIASERQSQTLAGISLILQELQGRNSQSLEDAMQRIAALEQQLLKLLDEKGQGIWSSIQQELRLWNYSAAISHGKELEQWLHNEGQNASALIRWRAFVLLAHLACFDNTGDRPADDEFRLADEFAARAMEALGTTPEPAELSRLARFRAKRRFLAGQYEQAIAELTDFDDSEAVSTRIAIHLDAGYELRAVKELDGRDLAKEWV